MQRAFGRVLIGRARLCHALCLIAQRHHRIYRAVHFGDPVQRSAHQIFCADPFSGNARRKRTGAEIKQIRHLALPLPKADQSSPCASARLLPDTFSASVAPISPSRSPSSTPLVSEVS